MSLHWTSWRRRERILELSDLVQRRRSLNSALCNKTRQWSPDVNCSSPSCEGGHFLAALCISTGSSVCSRAKRDFPDELEHRELNRDCRASVYHARSCLNTNSLWSLSSVLESPLVDRTHGYSGCLRLRVCDNCSEHRSAPALARCEKKQYGSSMQTRRDSFHSLVFSNCGSTNDDDWVPVPIRGLLSRSRCGNAAPQLLSQCGEFYSEVSSFKVWREALLAC